MSVLSNVDEQRARYPFGNLLRHALPLSQLEVSEGQKPALLTTMLRYEGDASDIAVLCSETPASQQQRRIYAVTQASGSGKTKLAYAVGESSQLVVFLRVIKHSGS